MARMQVEVFDPLAQLEVQVNAERLQENREHAELIAKAVAVARQQVSSTAARGNSCPTCCASTRGRRCRARSARAR